MATMIPRAAAASILSLVALVCGSCGNYESCDKNQMLWMNICIPLPGADGGPQDGPEHEAASCAGAAAGFGITCMRTQDCTCGTNVCVVMPGATTGYCSKVGCLADPQVCPTGYMCFDARPFNGPDLCLKM